MCVNVTQAGVISSVDNMLPEECLQTSLGGIFLTDVGGPGPGTHGPRCYNKGG